MNNPNNRRQFIKTAALGVAATALATTSRLHAQADAAPAPKPAPPRAIKLGLASYSVRKFDYEKIVLPFMKRLGLTQLALKDFHLPLTASDEQIHATVAAAKTAGITLYGCGVIYMRTPADVERAFQYAGTAGFDMIIGAPNVDLLPLVEKKVKETNVKLAIHNHGPGDRNYASPLDAHALIKDMDTRMGLCFDIGHVQRLAQDPVDVFKATFDRVLDVHIKDVTASSKAGGAVEMGRGVIDIPGFLKTVVALGYAGTLGLEYEKNADDPFAGVAESIGYTRGALTAIGGAWR
jgi:sugar phosphate isomerase/epimerase